MFDSMVCVHISKRVKFASLVPREFFKYAEGYYIKACTTSGLNAFCIDTGALAVFTPDATVEPLVGSPINIRSK